MKLFFIKVKLNKDQLISFNFFEIFSDNSSEALNKGSLKIFEQNDN